jgi:DNA-binding LacI/PurR family transcriptional regulator
MSKATLNQVAQKAGVSKTTVSLVLNGKADRVNIAQATRKRVIETAKTLNYRPGKFNPVRLNGHSGIIGFFAGDFSRHSNSKWLQHLTNAATTAGYVLLPQIVTKESFNTKTESIPFDAIIITERDFIPDKKTIQALKVPVICAGFATENAQIKSATPDFAKQTTELIQLLYRHNKKAIGMLCTTEKSEEQKTKIVTYKENYCERFDIPPNIEMTPSATMTETTVNEACKQLIEKGANGIIFETSQMAYMALRDSSVRLLQREDIMFAAYNKIEGSELLPENLLVTATPEHERLAKGIMETVTSNSPLKKP